MKLAFCLFKYFPYGGLQRDFMRIAHACRMRGHEIRVYTLNWRGDIPPGFDVTQISVRGITNHGRCRDFADKVNSLLNEDHCDVVVGFNKMPGLDVYFAGDPCFEAQVRRKHGVLYRLGPRYRCFSDLERAVFKPDASTKILLLSEAEKPQFMKFYGTPEERFHLVPPGIAKDRTAPLNAQEIGRDLRREFGIPDDQYLLLMIGSDFERKGVDRSIGALASLPEGLRVKTQLFVIGVGKIKRLQTLAGRLGVTGQVSFLGGRDDVPRFLFGADLFLHPARSEAAGMVLVEALVAGLPVLATDVCGYAFHIKQAAAGLLIPTPFRQQEFNAMLERILNSPHEREEWKRNGLAYASRADLFSLPERAADIIESVSKKM